MAKPPRVARGRQTVKRGPSFEGSERSRGGGTALPPQRTPASRQNENRAGSGSSPREALVAPVEVAGAIDGPEAGILDRIARRGLRGLFARPWKYGLGGMGGEVRLDTVHRLLEARLLLGLEQRVVLERIGRLVAIDRHLAVERGVPLLQRQVILDDFCEQRRCLYRHNASSRSGTCPTRGIVTLSDRFPGSDY